MRAGDPAAPSLALVASVALHEVVEAYAPGVEIRIKWPNDLLAIPPRDGEGDRPKYGGWVGAKLSGILLEREGEAVVIGFGVNLAGSPDAIDLPVASLQALTGSAPDPASFLEDLAAAFERWLARWRSEGLGPVRSAWLARAHAVGTALSTTDARGERLHGLFDGLDEGGALRLRLADGTSHVIHAGDVFLI